MSPREVALLAERLPSFSVDSVAGAGHFVYEEQPEAVVAAVERLRGPAALKAEAAP